mmetsp:Transcript_30/g.64  ORF Transcript_30/g.64 Transcript_30/m.64 type:complete len:548 (+) Transcript_30:186-1829(+)
MIGITIFSAEGCDKCRQLKASLAAHDVVYSDISLSRNPERIYDLVSLCGRNGVPQVFVDSDHIGGGDDAIALMESGKLDRYRRGVFVPPSVDEATVDARLAPSKSKSGAAPHDDKETPDTPPRDKENDTVVLPDGESVSILEMTSILMIIMPRADLSYHAKVYRDSFTGSDGVEALMEHYDLEREEAVELGIELQRAQLLDHVCSDHEFGDTQFFFRLQPFRQPRVLNTFRVWTNPVDYNFMALMERLKKLMDKIEARASSIETGLMDYSIAESDPHYLLFEEQVCELQKLCLPCMNEKVRRAFMINLYNLMTKHAYIKVGVPSTSLRRASFFGGLSYNIGGVILSFNDIEHGILRANTHPPYHLRKPFSKFGDKRASLALSELDPRIHFALNCGARSCPPIRYFSVEAIDRELDIAAQAFVSDDDNVFIDEDRNALSLTMIFHWYRADFADSKSKLPDFIVKYLHGKRREALERMINLGKKITIEFKPYDWSVAAEGHKDFEGTHAIDPSEIKLKSFFSGMHFSSEKILPKEMKKMSRLGHRPIFM